WLAQWLSLYNDAKKADLPDVSNGRAQVEFLTALQGLDSQWATAKLTAFLEAEDNDQPSLNDLIGQFNRVRNVLPSMTTNRPQKTYGAFSAQDNQDNQDDDQPPQPST